MPRPSHIVLSLLALALATPAIATPTGFTNDVLPVLEANCFKCHGPDKQKGKLRLDTLSTDLLNNRQAAETWHDVRDALNLGEMPPDDEPGLASADHQKITTWITGEIDALLAKKSATGGETILRRLNRTEYQNTMRDLLGIDTDYAKNLPPESLSPDGFHNNGATQQMSDQLLEHYLTAARTGLKKAIVDAPAPETFHHRFTTSVKDKNRGSNLLDNDQQFVAKIMDYPAAGEILIRVKARAILAGGRGFPQLRPAIGYRADVHAPRQFIDPVDVTSEEWQTFRFRARIEHFPLPSKTQSKFPGLLVWLDNAYAEGRDKPIKPRKKRKPKKGQPAPAIAPYPNIEIASLEFTGPVFGTWPPAHHTRILPSPASLSNPDTVIKNFLQRAFRRPVDDAEITPFLTYFKTLRTQKQTPEEAYRETLAMALVSPGFLYLVEPARTGDTRLSDWEIASRLSYFLWSTMPDDHLFQLARAGKLHEPETLHAQVTRMLDDPRSAQFVENFTGQWLDVGAIDRVAVNPEYYPGFDNALKPSMRGETQAFFAELLQNNLSALNFIDSDFTMLDGPLAEHYAIDGPRGSTFERVALPTGSHRGGVLTHASILVGNSTGEDSHPVKRAVWLRDRLLHDPPDDPPPNVPALDSTDPDFARLPVREQLRLHREDSACNDCHRGIDPWGIALENFGGDGLWRDTIPRRKTRGKGFDQQPVVTTTTLPDGSPIDGIAQLKAYLLEHRQEQFAHAFTSKLLTYALGRTLEFEDQKTVTELTNTFTRNGHKIAPPYPEHRHPRRIPNKITHSPTWESEFVIHYRNPSRQKRWLKPTITMNTRPWHLHRRTFLRGIGTSLALPYLECMGNTNKTIKSPKRFCSIYFPYGVSLPKKNSDGSKWQWFPNGEGKDFQFNESLKCLEPLRGQVSVLAGLSHPNGRKIGGHDTADIFLTAAQLKGGQFKNSASIDQVMAAELGGETRFRSLSLSVDGGVGEATRSSTLSFDHGGQPVPSVHRPRLLFDRLFGTDDTPLANQRQQLKNSGSMLDLVLEHSKSVRRNLGQQDQQKLDEYLQSVRQAEQRVERSEKWLDVPKPSVDATGLHLDADDETPGELIKTMLDLMFLAYQTDSTRFITYQLGNMNGATSIATKFPSLLGFGKSQHSLAHGWNKPGGAEALGKWDRFRARQLTYFLQRLSDTQDGENGSLLDNTVVLYGSSNSNTHNNRNYPLVLAGGKKLGFKHGRFHRFSEDIPLSNLFLTALNRIGVPTDQFVDSTGELTEVVG